MLKRIIQNKLNKDKDRDQYQDQDLLVRNLID